MPQSSLVVLPRPYVTQHPAFRVDHEPFRIVTVGNRVPQRVSIGVRGPDQAHDARVGPSRCVLRQCKHLSALDHRRLVCRRVVRTRHRDDHLPHRAVHALHREGVLHRHALSERVGVLIGVVQRVRPRPIRIERERPVGAHLRLRSEQALRRRRVRVAHRQRPARRRRTRVVLDHRTRRVPANHRRVVRTRHRDHHPRLRAVDARHLERVLLLLARPQRAGVRVIVVQRVRPRTVLVQRERPVRPPLPRLRVERVLIRIRVVHGQSSTRPGLLRILGHRAGQIPANHRRVVRTRHRDHHPRRGAVDARHLERVLLLLARPQRVGVRVIVVQRVRPRTVRPQRERPVRPPLPRLRVERVLIRIRVVHGQRSTRLGLLRILGHRAGQVPANHRRVVRTRHRDHHPRLRAVDVRHLERVLLLLARPQRVGVRVIVVQRVRPRTVRRPA